MIEKSGFNQIRFELFFKSLNKLRELLVFYRDNNINYINIPCKGTLKKDFLNESINIIRTEYPTFNYIPHFSIQHQYHKNSSETIKLLRDFLSSSYSENCFEVLIVSGSTKKKSLDTVSLLNRLSQPNLIETKPFFGVAFNPYLTEEDMNFERYRLRTKIYSGLVTSIWLQFGTDMSKLERELAFLRDEIINSYNYLAFKNDVKLYGSIFVPSPSFISRFKFRPWKGISLSEEFLNSLDYAEKFISSLFLMYKKYDVIPLIETEVSTQQQLIHLKQLSS